MNKHQEHQHHQDHSENHTQIEISDAVTGETGDRESVMDELEKTMFERAR